jgi:hypothetical protein
MIAALLIATALGEAAELPVYDGSFRPLRKSERRYSDAGPAGPYYPQPAYIAGKSGSAIIRCRLVDGGELQSCKSVAERPRGSDFGPAAQVMANRKRIYVEGNPPAADAVLVRVQFVFGAPVSVEP